MIVVAVAIVEAAAHVFAHGLIDGQERCAAAPAMRHGRLPQEAAATPIDGGLPPRSLGETADRWVLSALSRRPRAIWALR